MDKIGYCERDLESWIENTTMAVKMATNIKRDIFRHFGSMAIPQSSKI